LLAIFPAFASIVTLYGLMADRASIAHVLNIVSPFLPRGGAIVLNAELHRLLAQDKPRLGFTFSVSTMIAIWSASGGLKAIIRGLNVAYDVQETRSFIHRSLLAFCITGGAILLCVLAIALATLLPILARQLPFHSMLRPMVPILGWPVALCVCFTVLAGIYRYGPNRAERHNLGFWGCTLSSSLWLLGTLIFKWYVRNFGNFDRVYGNLGAIVGFLVWIWLSLAIVMLGAELNRENERRK
jgi:membrane protein